jgi:hypothetical protein
MGNRNSTQVASQRRKKLSELVLTSEVVVSLEHLHIGSNPLLDDTCKKRRRQNAHQSDQPVSVHSVSHIDGTGWKFVGR